MDLAQKSVLVTGGTGFIGAPLCAHFAQLGWKVYVLTRKKLSSLNQPLHHQITYVNSLDSLQQININTIINLAGSTIATKWTKTAKKIIYESRINTTRAVIEYIKNATYKPELLISASAVGYYGSIFQQIASENSDSGNTNQFSCNLCQAWEHEAQIAETLGVRVALLRIGPVLAKDGGIIGKMFFSFYCGLGSQIGQGDQWISWIDRDDLIKLILFINDNASISGPINATAPHPVSNREFSLELARAMHRPCFLKIPEWFLKLLFGQMAEELMLHGQQVLPQKALSAGFIFAYPTIQQSFKKIFSSH